MCLRVWFGLDRAGDELKKKERRDLKVGRESRGYVRKGVVGERVNGRP